MSIKEQILLGICEKIFKSEKAIVSMDELYDDEIVSSSVRNISIDSPFQQLVFAGILSIVNEEDDLWVGFAQEGYYHHILSLYFQNLLQSDDLLDFCERLQISNVPGLEEGLALLLESKVLAGQNDFIAPFTDKYPQWNMPAARALIADMGKNGMAQIYQMLIDITNSDFHVLNTVFQLLEYQSNNTLHAELSKIVMERIRPDSNLSFLLLSHCFPYVTIDSLLSYNQQLSAYLIVSSPRQSEAVMMICTVLDKLAKEILRYSEKKIAFEIYQKAYELSRGVEDLKTLQYRLLGLIGQMKKSMGSTQGAILDYQQAIAGLVDEQEEETAAQNMLRLSEVYKQSGATEDAMMLAKQSIVIVERKSGVNSLVYASAISYLSSIHIYRKEWEAALPLVEKSMGIRVRLLGEYHTKVCVNYVNFATVLAQLGRLEKAKKYLFLARDIRIRKFGIHHQDVATTLHELGNVYVMEGDITSAISSFQQALKIRLSKLGGAHFFTCKTYLSLISANRSIAAFEQANLFEQQLTLAVSGLKSGKENLLQELAEIKNKFPG